MSRKGNKKRSYRRASNAREHTSHQPAGTKGYATALTSKRNWFLGVIVVVAVILAYQRVWSAGFIWDDDSHLTRNPCIVGPLGFKGIWTTAAATYYPLVLSSFWVQHAFWGLNPLPFHLVNVAVHAACAILLWQVLRRLQVPGAWLGAAIWALHPVQVESVAWITELKNTQSCLFYLLSILFFLKWRDTPQDRLRNRWSYIAALFCALLALLSKSSTVTLPVVLALSWWWLDGRWRWRMVGRLIPFLVISLAAAIWTIWEQQFHSGAIGMEWSQTWSERLIIAGCDLWFYLGKLFWPHPLIFIYPRWTIDASQPLMYLPALAAIAGMWVLWRKRNGALRPVFLAAAYFVVSLFPVLGFFNVYFFRYSFVGDHLQYLASMGPLALTAAGITTAFGFLNERAQLVLRPIVCATLMLLLATLTWRQCGMYSDSQTLWRTTLAQNPNSWMARNNLGGDFLQKGQLEEAVAEYRKLVELLPSDPYAHDNLASALLRKGAMTESVSEYRQAIELRPSDPQTQYHLGNALVREGKFDEAIAQFEKALELRPDNSDRQKHNAEVHYNLGNTLFQKGAVEEAIAHYAKALELRGDYAEAHNNLGNALLHQGRITDATDHYRKALELRRDYAEAHNNLGTVLLEQGQIDQAINHFQGALQSRPGNADPRNAEIHCNLGIALFQKHQTDEAIDHYRIAVQIRPDYAAAHANLGTALLFQGRPGDAIAEYEKTVELAPRSVPIRNNLARLLATCPDVSLRNGVRAVQIAQEAVELSNGADAMSFRALASAYAETGQFSEAIKAAERALEVATGTNNDTWNSVVRQEIESYRGHQGPTP